MVVQEMRPEKSTKVPLMRETYAVDVSTRQILQCQPC